MESKKKVSSAVLQKIDEEISFETVEFESELTTESIQRKIDKTFSSEICNSLSDENLKDVYRDQPSMKKKLKKLRKQMDSVGIESSKIDAYINRYFIDLIPAGLKGQVRGAKFNSIVKDYLLNLPCASKYEIQFENQHDLCECSDKPDFYIYTIKRKIN